MLPEDDVVVEKKADEISDAIDETKEEIVETKEELELAAADGDDKKIDALTEALARMEKHLDDLFVRLEKLVNKKPDVLVEETIIEIPADAPPVNEDAPPEPEPIPDEQTPTPSVPPKIQKRKYV